MRHRARFTLLGCSALLILLGCSNAQPPERKDLADHDALVGAWRSKISFTGGSLAGMKNLEFMYSYNAGGTMTESSNYDEAANSTPPAYGIWKQMGPHAYQTKYLFYTTTDQDPVKHSHSGDWWPAGHGVLTETITLSADGNSYTSTVKLDMFDTNDAPAAGGGEGTGAGKRITF